MTFDYCCRILVEKNRQTRSCKNGIANDLPDVLIVGIIHQIVRHGGIYSDLRWLDKSWHIFYSLHSSY